jgi:hypothetical protein
MVGIHNHKKDDKTGGVSRIRVRDENSYKILVRKAVTIYLEDMSVTEWK